MDEDTLLFVLAFMLIIAGVVSMIAIPLKPVSSVDIDIGINLWWLIGPFFVTLGVLIIVEKQMKR